MATYSDETSEWLKHAQNKKKPFGHNLCRKGLEIISTILDQKQEINDSVTNRGFAHGKIVNKSIRPIMRFPVTLLTRDDRIQFNSTEDTGFHIPVEGTGRKDYIFSEEEFTRSFNVIDEGVETLKIGEKESKAAKSIFHCKCDNIKKYIDNPGNATRQIGKKEFNINNELFNVKKALDARAVNDINRQIIIISGLFIIISVLIATFISKYSLWERLEPFTYFCGLAITIGFYVFLALTNKQWYPREIYWRLLEKKKQKNYSRFGFDKQKYDQVSIKSDIKLQ